MKSVVELRAEQVALEAEIDDLIGKEELNDEERTELEGKDKEAEDLASQIAQAEKREARKASLPKDTPTEKPSETRVEITKEPATYSKYSEYSYFRDMAWASIQNHGQSDGARERLQRHLTEVRTERPELSETRAVSRTDTTSMGEFVPPLWLVDEFAAALRAGRTVANLCTGRDLPPGTDSINFPKVTTGSTTAIQTSDNAALSSTDMVSATVTAGVKTIGGYEDVALQVLEQSPLAGGIDQMIFADLLADFNAKLDVQVISGSNASGQVQGILGTTGINTATYTQASPTVITAYPFIMGSVSQIARTRFLPATQIAMRPDRWYWIQGYVDSSGRPVAVPNMNGPFNATGVVGDPGAAQDGPVGWLGGLPVYIDANIPNNVGGATNEDRIIVGRFSDALLYEGPVRTSVHPDVLAHQMTMRIRLYKYVAFTAGRYPVSFATTTGTGNIVTTVLAGY